MRSRLLHVISQPIFAAVSLALILATWIPAHAVTTFDDNVTPDVIFGTGNGNGLFTVDRSAGVELGLRAKIPFTGVTHSNGDGTYSYSLAELLAAHPSQRWNFDWTVNTNWDGSSGLVIDDLTYLLQMDFDPGAGTDFLPFDPITPNVPPLNAPFFDHSIGTNATPNGGGTEATDGPTYVALIAANNVVQQSWRHAFFPFHPSLTYDPTVPGTYDIVLSAFDSGNNLVASTSIQVLIDGGCADRFVDVSGSDAGNDCLVVGTPCATIQHAVDEACSGDTVNVAAGTYTEQVLIKAKSLSLVGAGKTTTTIEAPTQANRVDEVADHGFGSRTYDYQVGVFGTGTETVNISGFTLDGKLDAKISGPGTFRSQQLTFLNASGTIEQNSLIDWQDSGAFGVQGVATLVIGSLTAETVAVRDNTVSGYQKTGIVAFGSGAVMVTIEDNTVTGAGPITTTAQNGIQISNGAGGSIIGNESTDANYTPATWCSTGILVYGVDGITVRNNLLTGSLCDLVVQSDNNTVEGNQIPAALSFPFSIMGNNNTVNTNVVSGSSDFGVYNDGTGNTYTCNRISGNAGGFYFDNYSGPGTPNVVNTNSIFGNGVGVDASSLDPNDPAIDATDNWWGCPAGPGGGGCDTVTANVDASLPAAAPPACVSCAADADCDDTLACTGAETCNIVTNVCQSGTPVVCSDQCETGVCEEPAGTCEPEPLGAPCDTAEDVCTELDTCDGGGTCTNTGGGGDPDGDLLCSIDDNCPADANAGQEDTDTDGEGDVCDLNDGPMMNLSRVILKRSRKPGKDSGGVRVKGDFISNPPTVLNTSSQITLTVTDSNGFVVQNTWDFATECRLNSRGKVTCKSADRRFKATLNPFRQTPQVFKLRVTFKKQAISENTVFEGPVTATLTFGPTPPALGSIDRVGTIADCKATGRGLKCRE